MRVINVIRILGWTRRMRGVILGDGGAGMAEYALLLFLVAIGAITAVTGFGDAIVGIFDDGAGIPLLP